tara:strand:- start:235 stop:477 length:243 start_codon:yes stop_codon:yes gene_type:complete
MRFFHNILPEYINPTPPVRMKEKEKEINYDDNIEKLRVNYGKEKRFWDLINVFLVLIILVWVLLFVVYYVQGKIKWSESY